MKNVWHQYKWPLLLLLNGLHFALDVIFYPTGVTNDILLFLPVFTGLTVLNYKNCQRVIPYILYQAFMLACIICAGYVSIYLYYHNISSDAMTPVVGEVVVLFESSIHIVTTVITAVKKAKKHAEK